MNAIAPARRFLLNSWLLFLLFVLTTKNVTAQVHPRFTAQPTAGTLVSIYVEEATFSSEDLHHGMKITASCAKGSEPTAKGLGGTPDPRCEPTSAKVDFETANYLYVCVLHADAGPEDCIPPFVHESVADRSKVQFLQLTGLLGKDAYRDNVQLSQPLVAGEKVLLVQSVYGVTTFSEVTTVGPPVVGKGASPVPPACRLDPGLRTYGFPSVPQGDYAVITYDARSGRMFWSDRVDFYNGLNPSADGPETTELGRTSAFMPVVYTRQKLLVLFCNMHFGASYAAQSQIVSMPEGTLDLRNTPPVNPTATPTATIDLDTGDTALNGATQSLSVTGTAATLAYSTSDQLLPKPERHPTSRWSQQNLPRSLLVRSTLMFVDMMPCLHN